MKRDFILFLLPLLLLSSIVFAVPAYVAPTDSDNANLSVGYSPVNVTAENISACNLNITYSNATLSIIPMTVSGNYSCFFNFTDLPIGTNRYLNTITFLNGSNFPMSSRTININKCAVINKSTTLSANISSTGDCFTVNNDSIVFDCKGYSITGNGTGDGISVSGMDSVIIRNCAVNNFTRGFEIYDSNYSLITDNYAFNNSIGIFVENSSNDTISYSNMSDNVLDMRMTGCADNTYTRNLLQKGGVASIISIATNSSEVWLNSILSFAPFPYSYQNGSGYINVTYRSDDWLNLTIGYSDTMQDDAIKPYRAVGVFWLPIAVSHYSQDVIGNAFTLATVTTTGVYSILGCTKARALIYGNICYAYIELIPATIPTNYVIGDVITITAVLSDNTLFPNISRVDLYYSDLNGSTYLAQPFLYNPIDQIYSTPYRLRQKSDYIQAMAIDNSSGTDVVIGYGSFYLYENPPMSFLDYLIIFGVVLIIIVVIFFLGSWVWGAL